MLLIITPGRRWQAELFHANQYVQIPAITERCAKEGAEKKTNIVWASQESGIQIYR